MENSFAERFKSLRKERKLTQEVVGKDLVKVRATIAAYEAGKIQPGIDDLIRISTYFDVTTDYLLGLSNYRTPDEKGEFGEFAEKIPEVKGIIHTIIDLFRILSTAGEKDSDILSAIEFYDYHEKLISERTGIAITRNTSTDDLRKVWESISEEDHAIFSMRSIAFSLDKHLLQSIRKMISTTTSVGTIQEVRELRHRYNNDTNDKRYSLEYYELIRGKTITAFELSRDYLERFYSGLLEMPSSILFYGTEGDDPEWQDGER